jgi:hypothetical protein
VRGSATPEDQELQFRQHYLVTGNVAGSARACNLSPSTGYDLARRANEDPDFVEARDRIHAQALKDAEVMMLAGLQIGLERLNKEPPDVAALASLGAQKVQVQDSGPHYLRGIVAGYEALTKNRRLAAELKGDIKPEGNITILVRPTANAEARAAETPGTDPDASAA